MQRSRAAEVLTPENAFPERWPDKGSSVRPAAAGRDFLIDVSAIRFDLEVFASPAAAEREWRQLEANGIATVFQRFDWVDAYVRHVLPHERAEPAIVLGRLGGRPAFVLPLAIHKAGPLRIARWIGGKHSGYNFGLWSQEAAVAMSCLGRGAIEALLGRALKGVDCAVLGRMPAEHDGVAQPLAALRKSRSSTEGYSFSLVGGFSAVLDRCDGAARRRRIKTKVRKLGEAGVLETATLSGCPAAGALEFFAEQKALRLAEQNCPNSFAAPGVMDFFHDLLARSEGAEEPLLEIAELSVGGKARAVVGSGLHRGRVNVYFMTFARDELAAQSPGQVLTFRHIAEACERGMAAYDLGVGFEDYKTHWCDVVHRLDDAYAAFTPLGAATVGAIRMSQAAKLRMRRNAAVWGRLKSAQASLSRLLPGRGA